MVEGNKKRLDRVVRRLTEAINQNDDAQTGTYIILDCISILISVLQDLALRPEVNSEE